MPQGPPARVFTSLRRVLARLGIGSVKPQVQTERDWASTPCGHIAAVCTWGFATPIPQFAAGLRRRGTKTLAAVCQQVVYIALVTSRDVPVKLWIVQSHGVEGAPMLQHPNARLTPRGAGDDVLPHRVRRAGRLRRAPDGREPPDRLQAGRPREARRGLRDRGSRPRRLAWATSPEVEGRVLEARRPEPPHVGAQSS